MFKQLKQDIQAVFDRDPAARNVLEVVTTYPGFHAIVMHRVCLLYTSPSPRDVEESRMPSSA